LIVPTIAAPITFFYIKQYMDSSLPLALTLHDDKKKTLPILSVQL